MSCLECKMMWDSWVQNLHEQATVTTTEVLLLGLALCELTNDENELCPQGRSLTDPCIAYSPRICVIFISRSNYENIESMHAEYSSHAAHSNSCHVSCSHSISYRLIFYFFFTDSFCCAPLRCINSWGKVETKSFKFLLQLSKRMRPVRQFESVQTPEKDSNFHQTLQAQNISFQQPTKRISPLALPFSTLSPWGGSIKFY